MVFKSEVLDGRHASADGQGVDQAATAAAAAGAGRSEGRTVFIDATGIRLINSVAYDHREENRVALEFGRMAGDGRGGTVSGLYQCYKSNLWRAVYSDGNTGNPQAPIGVEPHLPHFVQTIIIFTTQVRQDNSPSIGKPHLATMTVTG
jgi:hypothetical protein